MEAEVWRVGAEPSRAKRKTAKISGFGFFDFLESVT
jgi:hypothetical protein